jgi:hypothetical protein
MVEFYFQIKGLDHNEHAYDKWQWPPLFSGRVEAENSKEARVKVNAMFGEKFPGRVKQDDNSKSFLLHIKPMSAHFAKLFEVKECEQCGSEFRRIDLYNDHHETYKGPKFCSQECQNAARAAEMVAGKDDPYGNKTIPCIYRITNKKTGMVYIGQTRRAFTLRWWQHVKWGADDCKFHQALRDSSLTDWTFEVIEVCEAKDLDEREAHHIAAHNSVDAGYNSVKGNAATRTQQR